MQLQAMGAMRYMLRGPDASDPLPHSRAARRLLRGTSLGGDAPPSCFECEYCVCMIRKNNANDVLLQKK